MNAPHQLDDVERERFLSCPLAGDRAVEEHACTNPVPVVARPAPYSVAATPTRFCLAGEWVMRGSDPRYEYSIDHWTASRGEKPTGGPPTWWREETDRSDWLPAYVPGTVQAALVASGEMPDPLLGRNTYEELTAHGEPAHWPWHFRRTRVERQEWWFARSFRVPRTWRGRRVRLAFDGVDYSATVYLNGVPIASHTGAYGGPEINVERVLRFEDENELVVRIFPAPRDWHGVMKASPGWGWHYGHLISAGIWRDVALELVPDLEARDPFVHVTSLDDARARLRVQVDVLNRGHEVVQRPVAVQVLGPVGQPLVESVLDATLYPGLNRLETHVGLDAPAIWWPFGYGKQPLHRLNISVGESSVATTFGVRTIEMATVPDWSDEDHYRWQFVVNGRRIFLKGANWCWTDPMAREGFEKDDHILDLMVDANVQLLRAWGGGVVERDEFYAACDRKGILVYQEFPLTFGQPEAPRADLGVIDDQVARIVQRLRNHPSLLMWGGGNENPQPLGADEVHLLVGRRVLQYDRSRPFHRTSPWGGSAHNYIVYHEGEPIDSGYRKLDAVVYGEYGTSSQCALTSMHKFLDPSLLEMWPPPDDGAVLQHQAQFSRFDIVKQLRYADYGPVRSWSQFVEYSQMAQGDALRYASEMVRAGSGCHTSAYFFYKVGEAFPGASWAVVDFYGVPKISYYRAKQFSRARSAFLCTDRLDWRHGEDFSADVHVANDCPEALDGALLEVSLWDAQLDLIRTWKRAVTLPPDERLLALRLEAESSGQVFLVSVRLRHSGALVSDQWYWFNAHPKSKAIRALESVPLDSLEARDPEEMIQLYRDIPRAPLLDFPRTELEGALDGPEIVVHNAGERVAFNVLVDGFPHGPGNILGDTSFCLRPGEVRRVRVSAPRHELHHLTVRAWNADTVAVVDRTVSGATLHKLP